MADDALSWEFGVLLLLLATSAFFSLAETSMMALNRYRLRHLVAAGHGGARRADALLQRPDRLLGAILLSNTLVNAASTTLVTVIAIRLFGEREIVLGASTVLITFLILVFTEITPKVIGATYPERIALPLAHVLGPVQKFVRPAVWFVNLFVRPLLALAGIRPENAREYRVYPSTRRCGSNRKSRSRPESMRSKRGTSSAWKYCTAMDRSPRCPRSMSVLRSAACRP